MEISEVPAPTSLLKDNVSDMKFYCVGYSVVRYYMNGYTMGNLEGHRAKTIGADLIATFLPGSAPASD